MDQARKKIAVLISGHGNNLQVFIDQCSAGALDAEIALVLSNRPEAYGLKRAQRAGILTKVIDHTLYENRASFDAALIQTLDLFNLDVIVLAGFMRILTNEFVQHYRGKLLNIHPSLLPKYPGLYTHRRAIESGDNHSGATVHFVTEELDGGPAVLQAKVAIDKDDTVQALAQRVLDKERCIYPLAILWFLNGKLELQGNDAYYEQQQIPPGGKLFEDL